MSVDFHFYHINTFSLQTRDCKSWIKNVIENYSFRPGDIQIIFTSDEFLLGMNKQYLNHHYYTDIITFNYTDGKHISGELYISIPTVSSNADRYNTTFLHELHRVIIHGILHLIGFDDQTREEKSVMRKKEDEALNLLKDQ